MHSGHDLPSALPRDDELSDAASKLSAQRCEVRAVNMPNFTPKSTKKSKTGEAGLPRVWDGGDPALARGLSNLGVLLDSDEECPGWTPLNPVRSFGFAG